MVQINLNGEEVKQEVVEEEETKKVYKLMVGYFFLRITPEAWDTLLQLKDKEKAEERPMRIKRWVQTHARAYGGKKPIDRGAFDRDTDALYERIMEGEQ